MLMLVGGLKPALNECLRYVHKPKYLCKKPIINMTSWIRNQIANLYDFVSAPIVQTSPFLLKGVGKWGVNFDYLPWREGS